jgi:hypothetical protein
MIRGCRLRPGAAPVSSAVLSLLMGCLPIPYVPRATPPIDGLLVSGGVPVSGVRVLVSSSRWTFDNHDSWCKRPRDETRTDSSGRFRFDSHRIFHPVVPIGDSYESVNVCAELDGVMHHLWSDSVLWGFKGVPIPLVCDLRRAKAEVDAWEQPACYAERVQVEGGIVKKLRIQVPTTAAGTSRSTAI